MSADITVRFDWRCLGTVTLDDDRRLVFPDTPNEPGVYTITLGSTAYIGEGVSLRRRWSGYRNPSSSQQTNKRMNPLIVAAASTEVVTVDVVTAATVVVDNKERQLDLRCKSARLLVESAAITTALARGIELHNL
jgi:hypothetical protein